MDMDQVRILSECVIKIENVKQEPEDHTEEEVCSFKEDVMLFPVKRELKEDHDEEEDINPPIGVFLAPEEVSNEELNQEFKELQCFEYVSVGTSQESTTNNEDESADESIDSGQLLHVEPAEPNNRNCNSTPRSVKKPKKQMNTVTAAIKELKDLIELLTAPPPPQTTIIEDNCEIMGKQITSQLRMLPEDIRLRANLQIQRILMYFRMELMKSNSTIQ